MKDKIEQCVQAHLNIYTAKNPCPVCKKNLLPSDIKAEGDGKYTLRVFYCCPEYSSIIEPESKKILDTCVTRLVAERN